jgi:hypothetical protein
MPQRPAYSRSGGSSGSKHLPWDANSITPIRQLCRKNPDFRSEFACGKVARRASSHALAIIVIVRPHSACGKSIAGRLHQAGGNTMIDRLTHPGEAMVTQGSSFRAKGECPDDSSAHVNPGSDSPHSVRACRQAFAEDPARPLHPPSASLTQLRSFSGTRWSLNPRPSH